jgi:retron-type reverse transcriptase
VIGPETAAGGYGSGGDRPGPPPADDLYSFRALWRHYRDCRRTKRNTLNALAFEVDAEAKLRDLQAELRAHTYRPGQSICFVTDGPKPREVFAADFRDRIVHHLLVWHQERIFEPMFSRDSYACRRGKGTLAASDRLMQQLRQATANGRRPAWALRLDVASFFPSIHKRTLFDLLERRVRHPELRWLTEVVLFHDPTKDYRFRSLDGRICGPQSPDYPVPARKSLFGKRNEGGLPIGNLTSQFWANVYLNELDQFAKRHLRCRYYVRYVDDVVLLSPGAGELVRWREAIAEFLNRRLDLSLRDAQVEPQPVRLGVDFVGWRTWGSHRVARRQTLANLERRLGAFTRQRVHRAFGGLAWRIDLSARQVRRCRASATAAPVTIDRLRIVLASYSGHLRHGSSSREWERTWARYAWLPFLFRRSSWDVRARWTGAARYGRRFGTCYRCLIRRIPDRCLCFLCVGRYVEFYGPQRLLAERTLGLRRIALPRAGYGFAAGFPVALAGRFAERAMRAGVAVVLARLRRDHPGRRTPLHAILLPNP